MAVMGAPSTLSDDDRREHWERTTEWPLTITALVFLLAYAWPILDPRLPPSRESLTEVVGWVAWAAFAVDYVVRLVLSTHRWDFVRRNLLDLAVVALPLLRPLRLLRLVTLLVALNRRAGGSLRGRVSIYVAGSALMAMFVAALGVLDAERNATGANIRSFGDALWWSAETVTTVGYGDRYPVTTEGRIIAAGLMLGGIALIGTVTATLASWIIERVRQIEDSAQAATSSDVQALREEVERLRDALATAGAIPTGAGTNRDD